MSDGTKGGGGGGSVCLSGCIKPPNNHVFLSLLKQTDRLIHFVHRSGGDVRCPMCAIRGPLDRTEQRPP